MNAPLDWNDLSVFLAVAMEGGATAAARKLRIHHATASRHVSNLERQLGTRLFERSRRGMALTAAGQELLEHVLTIRAEIDAIGRRLAGRDARVEGTVRVSTVDDLAMMVMPDLIRAFQLVHPDVRVELDVRTQRADLTSREADIALRFGKPPEDPGVVRRKIATPHGGLYASADYLRAHPMPDSPEELRAHCIVRAAEGLSGLPTEKFFDRFASPDRTVLRSDSMLAQFAAVQRGLGIGWLSHFMVQPHDALREIPIEVSIQPIGLWMVIHADMRKVARIRAFADYTYDYFAAMRDRFERISERA